MERTDMTSNDLDRACAQVGLFMYHFANLENQIDAAVAKLFELKDNTAQMINGSVDFFKRYNLVHTAVHYQVDENEYKRLKKILTKVTDHNKARQVVAHSRFEPVGDGVKFTRVVARDGTVTIPDETWSKEKFDTQYKAMQKTITEVSASRLSGIDRPSALTVLRLMTNSNLVGCTTGKSAGFSPLRIRPA